MTRNKEALGTPHSWESPLTALDKGVPALTEPLALTDVGAQGWSLLEEDLPLPVAVTQVQDALLHNSEWMRSFLEENRADIAPHGKTTMVDSAYRVTGWFRTATSERRTLSDTRMIQMSPSKIVMITGAASGIGAATAGLAAAKGHHVVVADIDSDRAAAAAGRIGGGSWPIKLDIRSEDGWTAALDEAWRREGQLDVLINNAAIVHTGWVGRAMWSLGGHRNTMETNFFGAVIGMMTALPRMKAQGHGHLISISSMNAFIPYPGIASYAAAKHALRAFHAALALEERESAVNFTLVYPTATETPMLEKESEDDALALAFSGTPIQASAVAKAVLESMTTKPVEIFIPAERGEAVKRLGLDPAALRAYVETNEPIGLAKLKARRAQALANGLA